MRPAATTEVLKLDRRKVSQARWILKAQSDQETLDRALDIVRAGKPILQGHRRLRRGGGFVDVFVK